MFSYIAQVLPSIIFPLKWFFAWNYPFSIDYIALSYSIDAPDSNVLGAYMGPTWGRQDPCGPHVGPMNLAIWGSLYPGFLKTRISDFSNEDNFVFLIMQVLTTCVFHVFWTRCSALSCFPHRDFTYSVPSIKYCIFNKSYKHVEPRLSIDSACGYLRRLPCQALDTQDILAILSGHDSVVNSWNLWGWVLQWPHWFQSQHG